MWPFLAVSAGLLLLWLVRRQQPPRALFIGTGPYFWLIAPFIALFSWMVLVGWSDNTPGQKAGIAGFVAFMWVLLLALASPTRFRWAPRLVTGTVALAYLAYAVDEALRTFRGEPIARGPSAASLPNALLGLLVYGVPAALYTLW